MSDQQILQAVAVEVGEVDLREPAEPVEAEPVLAQVRAGDLVLLHDPQTVGLAQPLIEAGVQVVWRCHIGVDAPNEHAMEGWRFLEPYLEEVERFGYRLGPSAKAPIQRSNALLLRMAAAIAIATSDSAPPRNSRT